MPGVVGEAAGGGQAQLVEDGLGVVAVGGRSVEPLGQPCHDPQFAARTGRRLQGAPAAEHAALEVGHRAFLLGPLGHRQDDVGDRRGLGEEEVADHQQVEAAQAVDHGVGVGGRHHDVRAVHEEAADAVGLSQGLQQLDGGQAGAGNQRFRARPTPRRRARGPRGR